MTLPTIPSPRQPILSWCATIVIAVLVGGHQSGVLRVRHLLLGAILLVVPMVWRTWRAGDPDERRMLGAVALALPPLAAITLALGDSPYEWLPQVALLLLGTAWLVATTLDRTTSADDGGAPRPNDWAGAAALAAVVTFGGEWLASTPLPRIVDESWFLMQADLLGHGRLRGDYPAGLERLYGIPLGRFVDGSFTSQYPLGWPALLALPVRLGVERWLPPLLGFLAAIGAGLLARRVAGPVAGLAALVLAAGSPLLILGSWTYFSQVVSAALLVYAALALEIAVAPAERPRGSGIPAAALCGLLGGVLFAVRPLTAVAFGAVAALRVAVGAGSVAASGRLLLALALGFAGPAVLIFLGNAELTGSWHRFGYEFVNGRLAAMGFGDRGYFKWMPDGRLAEEIFRFTPRQGAGYVLAGAFAVLATFLPIGLLLPLAARRDRDTAPSAVRWWGVAIGVLVAVHGFWFYRSTRFFEDAIPLLAAIAGCLLASMPRWRAHARASCLQLATIGTAAVAGAAWLDHPWHRDVAATVAVIEATARERPTVVVVEGVADRDAALQALFPLNGPRHAQRVQVVRDIGLSADSLRVLFPGRTILRLGCAPCDEQRRAMHPAPKLERLPDAPTAGSAP